jgi:uncharacterized protein
MKKIRISLISVFILINIIGIYTGNMIYNMVYSIDIGWGDNHFQSAISTGFLNYKRYSKLYSEEVSINSKYGYRLYGTYIKNDKPSRNTIIILHGIGCSRWTSMKYADIYLDKGFNVLVYDSRGYGESGGGITTFGFYEKHDLDSWVDFISAKYADGIIGVHGESMGGATALLHSKINEENKRVSFYVVDSTYSDLKELGRKFLKESISKTYLSTFVYYYTGFYVDLVTFVRGKFLITRISPIKAIENVSTPIMFIHGKKDEFVPSSMSQQLYEAKKGIKSIYISPSDHVHSIDVNGYEYAKRVYSFIDEAVGK